MLLAKSFNSKIPSGAYHNKFVHNKKELDKLRSKKIARNIRRFIESSNKTKNNKVKKNKTRKKEIIKI